MFIIIYCICLIIAYILFFLKRDLTKYKKTLIRIHLACLVVSLIQLILKISSDYALYGTWTLPMVLTGYFASALFLFVHYCRSSNILMKIYGGLFFFYPIFFIVAALFARIVLILGISITFFALNIPDNLYSGKGLIIREGFSGVMAASQKIELYKSCFPLVKKLGETDLGSASVNEIKIDSILLIQGEANTITIKSNPENRIFRFYKSHPSKL